MNELEGYRPPESEDNKNELPGHRPPKSEAELTRHFDHVTTTELKPLTKGGGVAVERLDYGKFFRGGKLSITHVTPDTTDTPEESRSDRPPIIVVEGFIGNGSKIIPRPFSEELARATGREVFAITERGYRRRGHNMTPHRFQPPGDMTTDVPVIDEETAALVSWFMDNNETLKGAGKVDLVAKSAGIGPAVITATGEKAGKIDTLYIAEGAMHKPMNAGVGLAKFTRMVVGESLRTLMRYPESRHFVNQSTGATTVAISTHLLRLAAQVRDIAHSNYGPVVAGLQKQNGSNVVVETAKKDSFFGKPSGGVRVDTSVPDRGHNAATFHPQETAGRVAAALNKGNKDVNTSS
jgi:hypothetical protein